MKFQIFILSLFIFSTMILMPSYAQEMPSSNIKIFQLTHNQTDYDIPYVLSNGNINTIDLDPDAIRISLSEIENSGFMEINIPSEFYNMLPCVYPQTDYPDYFIEIFGEIGWLLRGKRTATVRCIGDVEAIRINGDMFMQFLEQRPDVGFQVMRNITLLITKRLSQTNSLLKQILWNINF